MRRLAICLGTTVALAACTAVRLHPISKEPGWTYMGNYSPAEPKSLSELPDPIRLKLLTHLRDRLGSFAERLTFTGGQIVDFDRLAHDEPNSKDYQWEVHAYDLHFAFQMPSLGIASYTAQIRLRSDGSVLEEIDLPNFAKAPEKLNFISLKDAASMAIANGFSSRRLDPDILYFKEADALVWSFQETTSDDGLITRRKNIYISAHDGAVLKEFSTEGIR